MDAREVAAALVARERGRGAGAPLLTAIPRLAIWHGEAPTEAALAMFEAKLYLVLQGAKRLVVGGRRLDLGTGDYVVAAVDLPTTCQVTEASPQEPYLAVELGFDAGAVAGLLLDRPGLAGPPASGLAAAAADEAILDPLGRLLRLLHRPDDIPVLAAQVERELWYRLLQGPAGGALAQLIQRSGPFERIRTAVAWLREHADEPLSVARLASEAGMSVTSFHRHFRAVTAQSPLAFQRRVRLLAARAMVASGACSVTTAAVRSGYASPSQFSREYKRLFGVPPVRHAPAAPR